MSREPGETALALCALEKSFPVGLLRRRRAVLRGVDLELGRGERLGLVGPNGSGKSTLLRLISGVEPASGGEVRVFGTSPHELSARRRTGFLPEASPFPPELRARTVLELVASLNGVPAAERGGRIDTMLDRVGLGADAGRRLESFSLGMLRRFGLAQAFLHEPDLLLLDEPTAGLDAPGNVVLDELLGEAHARGATLVIASHQLADILDHCDRLVILIAGRIAAAGTPRELLADGKRLRLEIEGLTGPELDRIEGEIEEAGGRVISRGPARGTLIELYREGEAK